MFSSFNDRTVGYSLAFLSLLLLSFRSILVKFAYQENILLMDLFYLRFLFALPMLFLLAFFNNKKDFLIRIVDVRILLMTFLAGIFGYYLATLLDFYALELIPANISRVTLYIFPIFILLINSVIKKEVPNAKDIFTFIFAFLSIFLVMGGVDLSLLTINIQGVLFSLMAAFSYAIYIIINNSIGKKVGSSLFTFMAVFFSFMLISIHYFCFNDQRAVIDISSHGWMIIFAMSFFCTFLPLVLISEAITKVGLYNFSLFSNIGPALAVLVSFFTLYEIMTWQQLMGVVMVILILYKNSK